MICIISYSGFIAPKQIQSVRTNNNNLILRIMTDSNVVIDGRKTSYIKLAKPLPLLEYRSDNQLTIYKTGVIENKNSKQVFGPILDNQGNPMQIDYTLDDYSKWLSNAIDNKLELYVEGMRLAAISFVDYSKNKAEQVITRTFFSFPSTYLITRQENITKLSDRTLVISKINFENNYFNVENGNLKQSFSESFNPDIMSKNNNYAVGINDILAQHCYQYLGTKLKGYLCLFTNKKKVVLQGYETEFNDSLVIKNSTAMVSMYNIFKSTDCAITHDTKERVWDVYLYINKNLSTPLEHIHIRIADGSDKFYINDKEFTFSETPIIDTSYGWNYTSMIPLKDALAAIKLNYYYRASDKSFLIERFR